MRVKIKEIQNGWMVRYSIYEQTHGGMGEASTMEKVGECEKAFTYDFEDEMMVAWNKVINFLHKQAGITLTEKQKYLTFSCPKCSSYAEQGFTVLRLKSEYTSYRDFWWEATKAKHCPFCGSPDINKKSADENKKEK